MKTVNQLKSAEIILDNETVETVEIKNPCQMWKSLKSWQDKYGQGVRVIVRDINGSPYKDFTVKVLKNGKTYMVNAVTSTNRVAAAKAKKAAAEALAKAEEKKARKRAYDKARRERIKAAKAQTTEA
jgi:ABC-type enterochelin transport system ATPase subunit